jgi:hypothetical protein
MERVAVGTNSLTPRWIVAISREEALELLRGGSDDAMYSVRPASTPLASNSPFR